MMRGLNITTGGYMTVLAGTTAASCGLLLLSLFVTTPHRLGAIGVTAWFVLLLFALTSGFTLLLFGTKCLLRLHGSDASRFAASLRQALLLGLWFTCLLALGSLSQLSLRDVILLGMILLVAEVYIRLRYA